MTKQNDFREVFSVRVEVTRPKRGPYGDTTTLVYTELEMINEYVDCPNPRCHNGGFPIRETLRDMIQKRETHRECGDLCRGHEGSPKGRRRRRACLANFNLTIDLVYVSANAE